ncbi:MAG: hypothetical protein KDB53_13840 [Planctomycetes bacterium]|nr:hypothetical protein [Planctomycetota bacterium]
MSLRGGRGFSAWATAALVMVIFTTCVHRAVHESFTHDESLTWLQWARGPFGGIFENYIANNHVLNTIGVWASARAFGVSEWSLRLPALLGALVCLLVLARFARGAWGGGLVGVLGLGLVALNPFVLDYFVASRGYALALAGLLLGVSGATTLIESGSLKAAVVVGLGAGIAVTANLAFVFPVLGVFGVLTLSLVGLGWRDPRGRGRALWLPLIVIVTTSLAVALPMLVPLLSGAQRGHYDFGSTSLTEMQEGLVRVTLLHGDAPPLQLMGRSGSHWIELLTPWLAEGLTLVLVLAGLWTAWGWRRRGGRPQGALLVLSTCGLALTLIGLVAAHRLFDLPYPKTRTGLHLVVLASLGAVTAVTRLPFAARVMGGALLLVFVLVFASRQPLRGFVDWPYDQRAREEFAFLEARHRARGGAPIRVLCVPFQHAPALRFYADRHRADWLEVEALQQGGVLEISRLAGHHDFVYFLLPRELVDAGAAEFGLRVIRQDLETGTIVAMRTMR